MIIDDNLLTKLENLSYLKIDSTKREEMEEELTKILNFVENLNELNTEEFPSKFVMRDNYSNLRDDIPNSNREINQSIVKHSPKSEDNFFIVPKIIE